MGKIQALLVLALFIAFTHGQTVQFGRRTSSGSSRRGSARNIRFLSTRPTIRLVPQRTIQVQTLPASGEDHDIPPIYGYRYEIRAPEYQTYIQAEEQRDNDYTQGSYSWVDADGNLHTTTYYADATGYHPTHTVTPNAGLPR